MKLSGETLIAADRTAVWAALADPAVRARCVGAAVPAAAAGDTARFGADRTAFTGGAALTETQPPDRCVLVSADQHTSAAVTLSDDDGATRLAYVVTAASEGGDAPARAAAFFAQLKVEAEATPAPAGAAPHDIVPDIRHDVTDATSLHGNKRPSGFTPLVWGGVIVVIVLAVLVWQLSA